MLPTIQLLVEGAMYVSQGGITIPIEACYVSVELEESGLTSRSDQPVSILVCPHKSFSVKVLAPKGGGSSSLQV